MRLPEASSHPLLAGSSRLEIDCASSFVAGDTWHDLEAAAAIGAVSCLVLTGYGKRSDGVTTNKAGYVALEVLQASNVRYDVVSANAYGADWPGTLSYLETLPRLKHLQDVQEHRTWDVNPAVLDAQPFLLQYAEPDTMAVFELVR